MATYILLLTLESEGRERMLDDPESLLRAEGEIAVPGVQLMGLYGVLGDYDFVSLVEAPDNDTIARFSLELGVKAGAHVTTLPAIPITRFADRAPREALTAGTGVTLDIPDAPSEPGTPA
ncbi:MAG: GYD domain-containing protein [Dehalococcoidia bacterium]